MKRREKRGEKKGKRKRKVMEEVGTPQRRRIELVQHSKTWRVPDTQDRHTRSKRFGP